MNKQIFCIWSGDNKMSINRQNCLQSIVQNSKVNVVLVNGTNLKEWIKPEFPLHPAYEYLSLTHRSDYLRAYLMHHYGGGYTDIKHIGFDWNPYFDILISSENLLVSGYPMSDIAHVPHWLDDNVKNAYNKLPGVGQFIFKSNTVITREWINMLHSVLDTKLDLLKQFPGHYHARAVTNGVHGYEIPEHYGSKYPLIWSEILADVILPVLYSNINCILLNMPYANMSNYI
jgi:hypothetical protein